MEIFGQVRDELTAIFVPVGGGGLIAGIASYVKAVRPGVKVIGVEPFEADAMCRSLEAGRRIVLDRVGIFADGVAVREVGALTFPIVQATVDEVIRVSNDEICAAIKEVFDDTRSLMEPAGALSVAGLRAWVARTGMTGRNLVAVLSGANMNFDRLRFVAERADVGEAKEALFAVTIPERPGAFREFCATIGRRVVTEFNYRLSGRREAHIFVGLATESRQSAVEVTTLLQSRGYPTIDLTDDEMAKLHVRYMVGGRSPDVANEQLYRFEFPERPGALLDFLDRLGGRWNISLFHYRNHGSDFGRVLAGFEVPEADAADFAEFLSGLGYFHQAESDNRAIRTVPGHARRYSHDARDRDRLGLTRRSSARSLKIGNGCSAECPADRSSSSSTGRTWRSLDRQSRDCRSAGSTVPRAARRCLPDSGDSGS